MIPQHVLPREQVLERLSPILPLLNETFHQAWSRLVGALASHEDLSVGLLSTTRAGIVSDMFGHYAMPRLRDEHKAVVTRDGRMTQAVIEQAVAIRFKKVDRDLLSSNIDTASQDEIYGQEQTLPSVGPLTSITYAYQLDELGKEVVATYLTCPNTRKANHWVSELWRRGEGDLGLFGRPVDSPDGPTEDAADVSIKVPSRTRKEG